MINDQLPLVHGLIDAFLFLESASPDEVNPDSAVRCMENMTSSLLALNPADQVELRAVFERIAGASEDQAYQNFVRALPDMIGLEMSTGS